MTETLSKGDKTHSQILEQAHQLFLKQGYHGTSMRQIAQGAEIALGAIYYHFPSKEAIFEAIFLENHPYQEILPFLAEAEGDDPESLVRDIARRMISVLEQRPGFLNIMFIELVEFNGSHTVDLFVKILPQIITGVNRILALDPERVRSISPVLLARAFIGFFFSYYLTDQVMQPLFKPSIQVRTEEMETFVEIFLHGIMRETK